MTLADGTGNKENLMQKNKLKQIWADGRSTTNGWLSIGDPFTAEIMAAMTHAYDSLALPVPSRTQVLSIIGLSLPQAFAQLSPDADTVALAEAYKSAFASRRAAGGARPRPPPRAWRRRSCWSCHCWWSG